MVPYPLKAKATIIPFVLPINSNESIMQPPQRPKSAV